MPVTIATLQHLGEQMVDIHGQNEGRALLDPDRQRDLLDAFVCWTNRSRRIAGPGPPTTACGQRQALLDATRGAAARESPARVRA